VDGRRQLITRQSAQSAQSARTRPDAWTQAGALAGLAGPAAFTAAWIAASLVQPGQPVFAVQISGLAAENARCPWIMITGFLLLGAGAVAFGAALRPALGGWPESGLAPAVIQVAGAATIAAGLLRRDHLLLAGGPESWHNHAHDVTSAAAYVLLVAAPARAGGSARHGGGGVSRAACVVLRAAARDLGRAAPAHSRKPSARRHRGGQRPAAPAALTNLSRNSSSPWFCVVTKGGKLGLAMPQSANRTGIDPDTSMPAAVRSASSANPTGLVWPRARTIRLWRQPT
jgi:hypothetical protein